MAPVDVQIKETEARMAAFITMKGPFSQIPEAFSKLYSWIGQKQYAPSGPPSGVYFNVPGQVPEDQLSWEIQSPISGDVPSAAPDEQGLGVKRVEKAQVAAAMHKGPFEKVGETYAAMTQWIAQNGYEITGPPEEVYLTDPSSAPPEGLLTEIRMPVKKR